MERKTHTIDASGKILGRLATEVAILLQGKNKPNFNPNRDSGDFVIVKNIEKVKISGKKIQQKKYYRHSGYLGGLKEIPMAKFFVENPKKLFRQVVLGMLPKNKLRKKMIKRLKIE